MDPITDLFVTTQVASVVHARLEATAPWGLKADAAERKERVKDSDRPAISPLHLAHFGMVTRGHCWLTVEGIPEVMPLAGGDCFLLAPGSSYALRDHPKTLARSFCEIAPRDRTQVIEYGGGGARTTLVSGWFQFDPASVSTLKRLLPALILIRSDQPRTSTLHTTLNMLASEIAEREPGSDLVVNRLADVLFIECIRVHFGSPSGGCKRGALHAIFDPQIGIALNAIHQRPDAPWTVESLATTCGMSRSGFALRFKELVGETPLEYLTKWRMQKATSFLRNGDKKLFEVAKAVGYDSDAAFSKAFKRNFGVAPREYERNAKSSGELTGGPATV